MIHSSILVLSILLSFQCYHALKVGKPFLSKPKAVVNPDSLKAVSSDVLQPLKSISDVPDIFREDSDPDVELNGTVVKINKFVIDFVKDILGVIYGDRHYARFAALETIARVPYFSCKFIYRYNCISIYK